MSKTAVVILNWNGIKFLEKFIPKLIEHTTIPNVDLYVADNFSSDNSVEFLEKKIPQIINIKLDKNWGFAEGYNKALQQINADYFVLLNSDVEVTENWLQPLIVEMEKDKNIGACMPKIKDFNQKNKFEYAGACGGFLDKYAYPFCRGRIFDTIEVDENQYNNPIEVFWASGACFVVKAELYKKIGGLDKDFFAHMEEIDLCWRIKNSGYKIMVFPQSEVYHVGGGTLAKSNPKKTYLNFRNNLSLIFKNIESNKLIQIIIIRLFLDGIAAIKFLLTGYFKDFWAVVKAHFSFYFLLPSLIKKRKLIKQKMQLKSYSKLFSKSVVFEYFVKKKKSYSKLK
jgi:GT2 family glycosyltransferase